MPFDGTTIKSHDVSSRRRAVIEALRTATKFDFRSQETCALGMMLRMYPEMNPAVCLGISPETVRRLFVLPRTYGVRHMVDVTAEMVADRLEHVVERMPYEPLREQPLPLDPQLEGDHQRQKQERG